MADEHNAVERPRSTARIRHGLGWRMRKLKRRVREAAAWRARKAKRAYDARYRPPSTRRGMYVRLLKGECATGTKSSIVFVADNVGTDAHGVADVLGLALALAESGHGVRVIEVGKPIPDADVVVGATRLFDPSTSPPEALRVGWVRNEIDRWVHLPFLAAYDVVLAPSPMALTSLSKRHARVELLRPAVDTELFGSAESLGRRRRIRRASAVKGVARFRLPWLYGHSLVVVDRASAEHRKYGVVTKRFLEVAASGAVPLTNALIGVRGLGLAEVPGTGDAKDLPRALRSLPSRQRLVELGSQLREFVVTEHSWALRAEQLSGQILPGAERTGSRRIVHVAPFYRGNPYQAMLYAALPDIGAAWFPVADITGHLAALAETADPGLFHLHWTNPIVQPAEDEDEARQRLDAFVAALDGFRAAGGKLIWTIHNVLPHDARYHDLEIEMANAILHHADLVHLLSKETLDLVDGVYDIDEDRVVIVEHNSFAGIYPQWITRDGARERLGIGPSEKVLIVLGGIRPYKGIERMLDVFDELTDEDPSLRLLIAGSASNHPEIAELEERCLARPRILFQFKHLPDAELQAWFAAADVAVLPYVNILNSSAFQLAPTFGLPVVGPRMGALLSSEAEPHVRLFEPTSVDDLGTVVKKAIDDFVGNDEIRQAARQYAESRPPLDMATAFAHAIDPLLIP
ncbi:MAG TPA: glycosyltransferase [Aeromicrobium sp.]|nr:glycosyltransferase [Aeromicrobium sp.]